MAFIYRLPNGDTITCSSVEEVAALVAALQPKPRAAATRVASVESPHTDSTSSASEKKSDLENVAFELRREGRESARTFLAMLHEHKKVTVEAAVKAKLAKSGSGVGGLVGGIRRAIERYGLEGEDFIVVPKRVASDTDRAYLPGPRFDELYAEVTRRRT